MSVVEEKVVETPALTAEMVLDTPTPMAAVEEEEELLEVLVVPMVGKEEEVVKEVVFEQLVVVRVEVPPVEQMDGDP